MADAANMVLEKVRRRPATMTALNFALLFLLSDAPITSANRIRKAS